MLTEVLQDLFGVGFSEDQAVLVTDTNAVGAHLDLGLAFLAGDVQHFPIELQSGLQEQSRFADAWLATNQHQ